MKRKRLVSNARTLQWLCLGLILLLGTALRLYRLGRPSLWGDEINVAVASMGSFRQVLEGARSHVSAPPLDYLVVHLLARCAGTSEFSLRFGAAAWGILSIPLIFQLGRRLSGAWVGIVSALLLAVSPFHVWFSREVKFYAALVFFALLSNVVFLLALRRHRVRNWLLHCLVNCVGIYFHTFMAVVAACQGAYLLYCWALQIIRSRGRHRSLPPGLLPYSLSFGVTVLSFVPWYLWDIAKQTPVGQFHTSVDFSLLAKILAAFGAGSGWPSALAAVLAVLGVLLGARQKRTGHIALLVLNLLAIGMVVLLDNLESYWFDPKQVLFALPAYLTLAAIGLLAFARLVAVARPSTLLTHLFSPALAGCMAVGLALVGILSTVRASTYEKQDWRGVGNYLSHNVRSGDQVVQLWLLQPNSLGWYYHPDRGVEVMQVSVSRPLPLKARPGGDVWWVLVHEGQVPLLEKAVGDEFEVKTFAWLAVLHKRGGVSNREDFLDATAKLLELQGDLSPAYLAIYSKSASDLLRAGGFDLARVYAERGDQLANQGAWSAAAAAYERATLCWPTWGLPYTKLGNAYRALGQLADAEAAYRHSMQVEPSYVGAYINLAGLDLAQGRLDEALPLCLKALELAPNSAWAHATLGGVYLGMGDAVQAMDHLLRAVDLEPKNVSWLLALADGLRQLGQDEEATDLYRQVLALQPGNQRANEALRELQP